MTIITTSAGTEFNIEASIKYDIEDKDLREAINLHIGQLTARVGELERTLESVRLIVSSEAVTTELVVGSYVRLSKSSRWYAHARCNNPTNCFGTVCEIKVGPSVLPLRVVWDNGKTNSYDYSDLILVK